MKVVLIGSMASSMIIFRADLIKMLSKQGHDIYAFATDYDDKSRSEIIKLGGKPVCYTFSRSGLNPFGDLLNTFKLSQQLKKIQPDVTFSFFSKPSIFGSLASMIAGVKNIHGMLEGLGYVFTEQPNGVRLKIKVLKKIQIFLYKLVFPHLKTLILLNEDDRRDLVIKYNIKIKKCHVLGGIGLNLYDYPKAPLPTDGVSFIFVARLLAEKGVNEYISAAKIVKQKYPEIKFYMLGSIDKENPGSITEAELSILIDSNIIIYPGNVSNVAEWVSKSSVFVLPSYYREGVPRSTQEAMAIGRAILTTDSPGCRDTVVHGINGYLVPIWSPMKLADKMIELINNPEKVANMGEESYKMACDKFDATKNNRKLLKMLDLEME